MPKVKRYDSIPKLKVGDVVEIIGCVVHAEEGEEYIGRTAEVLEVEPEALGWRAGYLLGGIPYQWLDGELRLVG